MIVSQNGASSSQIAFTSNTVDIASSQCLSLAKKDVDFQSGLLTTPQNAEQLAMCLLDVETAKKLLASKLPLGELRQMLIGCYMRYHAIREVLKDSESNFFIDKIIHVNRDGIRFKHCRDNSYRSIHKIKEPVNPINQRGFNLWKIDMKKWNESLPLMDLQLLMLKSIRKAVTSLPAEEEEAQSSLDSNSKTISLEKDVPCNISRMDLTNGVITIEEMVKLIDYGKELFDSTVTGFYTQIFAPPNPHVQKDKKGNESSLIFMDQIIGVSWATKPYIILQRPLTIALKFRHFRDERLCQLPFWKKSDGISQEIYCQWLDDMRQWEYPTLEFIEKKNNELATVLSEPPKGPPLDVIKLATIEAKRENSTKLLRKLKEWHEEQKVGNAAFQPFPPSSFYPAIRPARCPPWPSHYAAPRLRPFLMHGRAVAYHPYVNSFHRPMGQAMMNSPTAHCTPPFGFYFNPQLFPSMTDFRPKAPKFHPPFMKAAAPNQEAFNLSLKASVPAMSHPERECTINHPQPVYYPQSDHTTFDPSSFQMGYAGSTWF